MIEKIKKELAKLCSVKGVSRGEIAKILGVSPAYISEIETGAKVPSTAFILKFQKFYNSLGIGLPDTLDISSLNEDGKKKLFQYFDRLCQDPNNLDN